MEVDHRCDIYALGVILYEMLTGAPPFSGTNYFQLLWAHGNEPPQSMNKRNPNVYIPAAIDEVVLRALAKKREDRFDSMQELSDALAAAAPEIPRTSLPSYPSPVPSMRPDPSARMQLPRNSQATTTPNKLRAGAIEGRSMRRGVIWAGAALLAGALGVTAIAVAGNDDSPETRVVIDTAPPPDPDPVPPPDPNVPGIGPQVAPDRPVPPPDPTATTVSVRFESRPPGARVYVDDDVVCERTPCAAAVLRSTEARSVRFSLARHRDSTRTFVPGVDEQVTADLRPARIRDPGGGPSTGIKGWND
jgi:serine/threonine-protein kinase